MRNFKQNKFTQFRIFRSTGAFISQILRAEQKVRTSWSWLHNCSRGGWSWWGDGRESHWFERFLERGYWGREQHICSQEVIDTTTVRLRDLLFSTLISLSSLLWEGCQRLIWRPLWKKLYADPFFSLKSELSFPLSILTAMLGWAGTREWCCD